MMEVVKAKGKNFSANNVNGKRRVSDFYETPYGLTRLFLDVEDLPKKILEPACGGGAIVRVLQEYGKSVQAFDKDVDFLKWDGRADAIVTNPPFSLAYEFILKAKTVTDKFCFLLPLSYLHGKKRFDYIWLDKDFPLAKVYVFTRYPLLGDELREDGKHRTGMMVYAWYVWERAFVGEPVLRWIDNHLITVGARGDK